MTRPMFTRTDIEPVVFETELLPVENPARHPAPARGRGTWRSTNSTLEGSPPRPVQATDRAAAPSGAQRSGCAILRTVGANAIWLAGYNEATDHFYGTWSAYAVRTFDRFDERLGTADDFQYLVDTAHANGIRVLLEVVSHGVLRDSPIVSEHPDWILEHGSWGMVDFDYTNEGFRRLVGQALAPVHHRVRCGRVPHRPRSR